MLPKTKDKDFGCAAPKAAAVVEDTQGAHERHEMPQCDAGEFAPPPGFSGSTRSRRQQIPSVKLFQPMSLAEYGGQKQQSQAIACRTRSASQAIGQEAELQQGNEQCEGSPSAGLPSRRREGLHQFAEDSEECSDGDGEEFGSTDVGDSDS